LLGSISDAVGLTPIAFASLIYILCFPSAALENVFTCRAVMFLGRISFPLYLIHVMPLLAMGHYSFMNGLSEIAFVACIAFTIVTILALSWMLHELVERPFHRLARRQTRGRAGSAEFGPVYG
jgi:peptidoglycan/LPS O-acetylase OafA/YrhL